MKCPLCTAKMKFHYRTLSETALKGYKDTLSCTECNVVVDLDVKLSETLHNVVNQLTDDGQPITKRG